MKDKYNRTINYMRLSVTDKCNFNCKYCLPDPGVVQHSNALSFGEYLKICLACVELGVDKIRITGGEPLVRKGIIDFCEKVSEIKGLKQLAMTTNGSLLSQFAKELKSAGVSRLNISLDTLNEEKFKEITNTDCLNNVLNGIYCAQSQGFDDIKINVVLIDSFNIDEINDFVLLTKDNDITIRFIELMPIGATKYWEKSKFVGADIVLQKCPELSRVSFDGVSELYEVEGYKGKIGLIRPVSNKFCSLCNKIRITSDGKIKTCLHSDDEFNLSGLSDKELKEVILEAITNKPYSHNISSVCFSSTKRFMNQIGG